jgi:outer membrane protein TolC
MLKKMLMVMGWIGCFVMVSGQNGPVTLEFCLKEAESHHPLFDQYDLLASTSELKIKNLNKNFLPEMNINGDAHYQSDVVEVPVKIEAFSPEPLDKDWYKVSLDVSQMIYDGGLTKRNKDVEQLDNEINQQNVRIDLYRLKERVIGVYFNIISLQESRELLNITKQNLQSRLKEVESGVKNGVVLSSNAEIIKAEILKLDQREIEIDAGIASGYRVLSILTEDTIVNGTALQWQSPAINSYIAGRDRPEFTLFSLQQQKAESLKKLTSSRLIPKLFAYGQAGYGRPGYNMLINEFDDFYTIGVKLSWNFYNWNRTKNEKSILDLQKEIVASSTESFDQNLSVDLERKMSEIHKIESLIPKDEEIVSIRSGIVQTYASQLQNGVITATEYITELHAETEAKLNLRIHQVQLVRAKYDYLATSGKL